MVKAFFDDSGKSASEPMFIIAGLVSSAEKWAAFSDEWAAALAEHPRLEYFKMRDAWALSPHGPFRSFSEAQRDARLEKLIAIINEHSEFFSYCRIDKSAWKEVLEGKIAKTLDSPFYHAYCWVVIVTFWHMKENSLGDTVDFVFDKENETIFREVLDWWLRTKEKAPPWMESRMGKDPTMDDDKKVLPLQAADLIAWLTSKNGTDGPQSVFAKRWVSAINVPGSHYTWEKSNIENLMQGFLDFDGGAVGPYEDGAARSERLNALFGPRRRG